ncbi:PA14 domain-containing protein [Toxoplasma gondii TgCatPRC2]|uniref:PA14 domain-containing protein n=1 Tax=Toxoplasma gondii TgCatPRC2 TaxID=1130821 RepID=A0A151HLL8_TOXGO|nr:PA14 domain-containing protein [Toxoplasma gondii TgCatPRC2]
MTIRRAVALLCLSVPACLSEAPAPPTNDPLQRLTEFRQQHRKTIDGRLCAAAFVQDNQTYTDCTDARSPDGTSGREWCYVEVQLLGKGPKDWNYCSRPINYSKLRAKAQEVFDVKAIQSNNLMARLDAEAAKIEDMIRRFTATCGAAHSSMSQNLNQIDGLLSRSQHCLKKMEEASAKIGLIEATIDDVKDDIDRDMKRAIMNKKNCSLVRGYEDEPFADGVRGAYYNNPTFTGAPSAFRTDSALDLVFSGKGPVEGVSSNSFSVRWEAFLEAPRSGMYTFIVESDCGVRMFLGDEPIIIDRMPTPVSGDAISENPVPVIPTKEKTGMMRTESVMMELVGGQKYRIRVEMVHSNHLKYLNPNSATIRLLWRHGEGGEEVIPSSHYLTGNARPPVKFSGLNPKQFDLGFFSDGERAFADSDQYFLADVPLRYEGRRFLRTLAEPNMEAFSVEVNIPATIYIASPIDEGIPVSPEESSAWKVHDTDEIVSVLFGVTGMGRALESRAMRIRFIALRERGKLSFKLRQKGVPFLIFAEEKKNAALSCGGEEEVLSLVAGNAYADCSASSEESDVYGCAAGLNGRHMDQPNGTWRTLGGNGVGEWMAIKFRKQVQITHFRFKPRDEAVNWPSEITLSYSEEGDEDSEVFPIRHTSDIERNTYKLARPVITDYVRAEITEMFVNGEDSGGSFEFLGSSCTTTEEADDAQAAIPRIMVETCDATVESIPEILPLEEGDQIVAVCPQHCVKSLEGSAYGTGVYAPGSTLCTAGVHAGMCDGTETACKILVTIGGPKSAFKGTRNHGVASSPSGPTDASVKLSRAPCHMPSAAPIKYFISFGEHVAPEGWNADDGSIKQSHDGIVYGWWREAPTKSCSGHNLSHLSSRGVSFPVPIGSQRCPLGADCAPNFWSVVLPADGTYRLVAQVAGPCDGSTGGHVYLQANGISLASGQLVPSGSSYGAIAAIPVRDHVITLTSSCTTEKCPDTSTTILNIELEKISNEVA